MLRILVVVGAVVLAVVTSLLAARATGIPLGQIAVYFDGHLYLEIAKSFPLPFAPEAALYAGHAPGYPAAIRLGHALGLDWSSATLAIPWLSAGLSTLLMWSLCRHVGVEPLWPTAMFALAHPSWRLATASAQPEALAMVGVLAAALACERGRSVPGVLLMAATVLVRFPAVLVAPALAWRMATLGKRRSAIAMLALPALVLFCWNAYIEWRVPGVGGIEGAHRIWLEPAWGLPFFAFRYESPLLHPVTFLAAAAAVAGLAAAALEMRRAAWLSLWFAITVLFHASMTGANEIWRQVIVLDFPRLTLLAWPALVLIAALQAKGRFDRAWQGATLVLAFACQLYATDFLEDLTRVEPTMVPSLDKAIERREDDRPTWPLVRE